MPISAHGILVTNPPYGERLGEVNSLKPLYKQLGDVMKQRFKGWEGYIFTANQDLAKSIGLKASRRFILYNGSLECRLLKYELFLTVGKTPHGTFMELSTKPARMTDADKVLSRIIYRDGLILIWNKPSGIAVHNAGPCLHNLEQYFEKRALVCPKIPTWLTVLILVQVGVWYLREIPTPHDKCTRSFP